MGANQYSKAPRRPIPLRVRLTTDLADRLEAYRVEKRGQDGRVWTRSELVSWLLDRTLPKL